MNLTEMNSHTWERTYRLAEKLGVVMNKVLREDFNVIIGDEDKKASYVKNRKAILWAINFNNEYEGMWWDMLRGAVWEYANDKDSSGDAFEALFVAATFGLAEVARWRHIGLQPQEAFKKALESVSMRPVAGTYDKTVGSDTAAFAARFAAPFSRTTYVNKLTTREEPVSCDVIQAMYYACEHNLTVLSNEMKNVGKARVVFANFIEPNGLHKLHEMIGSDVEKQIYTSYFVFYQGTLADDALNQYKAECARSQIPVYFCRLPFGSHFMRDFLSVLARNYWTEGGYTPDDAVKKAGELISCGQFFPINVGANEHGHYDVSVDSRGVYIHLKDTARKLVGIEKYRVQANRHDVDAISLIDQRNAQALLGALYGCVVQFTVPYRVWDSPSDLLDEVVRDVQRIINARDGFVRITFGERIESWMRYNGVNPETNKNLHVSNVDYEIAERILHSFLWSAAQIEVLLSKAS